MQFQDDSNTKDGNKNETQNQNQNETQNNMKKLLKQATLIKSNIYSEPIEAKKKPAVINKQATLTKPQLDKSSSKESNEKDSSREASPERKLDDDDQKQEEVKPQPKVEKKTPIVNNPVKKVIPVNTQAKAESTVKKNLVIKNDKNVKSNTKQGKTNIIRI